MAEKSEVKRKPNIPFYQACYSAFWIHELYTYVSCKYFESWSKKNHVIFVFYTYWKCSIILEKIMEISSTTGVLVDPVYNIKAVRGLLTEMKNNPHRFKGRRILYIHTGE